ncbi:MAG: hypothetical protein ACM3UO_00015 [Bacillota bacterium]
MKGIKRVAAAVAGLSVAAALIGSGVAVADPNPSNGPSPRPLQGMGSDTIQSVMDGISEVALSGGNPLIASWDVGGPGFSTRSTGCAFTANGTAGNPATSAFTDGQRSNGSGNGVKQLNASMTPGDPYFGCTDFARASSVQGAQTYGMTYIPFAQDAVAFAVTNVSNIPKELSLADLHAIYTCQYPGFTTVQNSSGQWVTTQYHALLPQAGSGTRKFFLASIGVTDPGTTNSASTGCLSDQKTRTGLGGTNIIEEHKGNVLDDNSIVPISVAQYISQSEGIITDYRGRAVLGTIVDANSTGATAPALFSLPMTLNNTYGFLSSGTPTLNAPLNRLVYNVVPTDNLAQSNIQTAFVGSNSLVCQQSNVIAEYGFGVLNSSSAKPCGDTTTTTAGN